MLSDKELITKEFDLTQAEITPQGYLRLVGFLGDEGFFNSTYVPYEVLKASTKEWEGMPITVEHLHKDIDSKNILNHLLGNVFNVEAKDSIKGLKSEILIMSEEGKRLIKKGYDHLSIGFLYLKDKKGRVTKIIPNHVSLVKKGSRPLARIVATKKVHKNLEKRGNAMTLTDEQMREVAENIAILEVDERRKLFDLVEDITLNRLDATDNEEDDLKAERIKEHEEVEEREDKDKIDDVLEDKYKARIQELEAELEKERKGKEEAKRETATLKKNINKSKSSNILDSTKPLGLFRIMTSRGK